MAVSFSIVNDVVCELDAHAVGPVLVGVGVGFVVVCVAIGVAKCVAGAEVRTTADFVGDAAAAGDDATVVVVAA